MDAFVVGDVFGHYAWSPNCGMGLLLVSKHEKYFKLCLTSLPSRAQSEDANRLAIACFCVQGLDLLGRLKLTSEEHQAYTDFIYSHKIVDPRGEIESFRGSQTFSIPPAQTDEEHYDLPNLAATYFGLAALLTLNSNYLQHLDRHKIMRFVQRLQITNHGDDAIGGFRPVLGLHGSPFGEVDIRHCYTALCIRQLVGYDRLPERQRQFDINVELAQRYILARVNYNGGLSLEPFTESHAGLTFCGIAALKLTEYDFSHAPWVEHTVRWLVMRQVDFPSLIAGPQSEYAYWNKEDIGGFNGRENKFADTCYAWWCTAALRAIGPQFMELIDVAAAQQYLLQGTQGSLTGGFGKDTASMPDPMHSFLGLAALLLWSDLPAAESFDGAQNLAAVDEILVVARRLRDKLGEMWAQELS